MEQLSKPRAPQLHRKFEEFRREREVEELKECTFTPRTGRAPSAGPGSSRTGDVHARLYQTKPSWQPHRWGVRAQGVGVSLRLCVLSTCFRLVRRCTRMRAADQHTNYCLLLVFGAEW